MTETTTTSNSSHRKAVAARSSCLQRLTMACAALMLLAGVASAGPILDIQGSTLGCFGSGCVNFGSPAYSGSTYGLTFTGSSFSSSTDATGGLSDVFLGSFVRANTNVSSSHPALDFTLQVTFTLPAGISGSEDPFTAFITGTNHGGGGSLSVDFDNAWQLFEFSNALGYGSFEFAVLSDLMVAKKATSDVFGHVRNATFSLWPIGDNETSPTESPDPQQLPSVPEPATLVLLGAGIAGSLARRARFRRG